MGQLHHSLRDNSTVIEYDLSLGETRQENWAKRAKRDKLMTELSTKSDQF